MTEPKYRYQIRYVGAPYNDGNGYILAEYDTLHGADACWSRHISVGRRLAPLDHIMTVTDGVTVWGLDDCPAAALAA